MSDFMADPQTETIESMEMAVSRPLWWGVSRMQGMLESVWENECSDLDEMVGVEHEEEDLSVESPMSPRSFEWAVEQRLVPLPSGEDER